MGNKLVRPDYIEGAVTIKIIMLRSDLHSVLNSSLRHSKNYEINASVKKSRTV